MEEVVAEATAWGNAQSETINQDARGNVVSSGRSEIVELSDDELTAWRAAMAPVWEEFENDIEAARIEAAASL